MAPDFTIVEMNAAYLEAVSRTREDILHRNMFDAFPSTGESYELLSASLARVRDEGVVDVLALIPYAITVGDRPEMRYWSATHTPLRGADGKVAYIVQHTQDVTELQRLKEAAGDRPEVLGSAVLKRAEAVQATNVSLLAERAHLRRLFMQAPGFMCVLTGPELTFELVNAAYMKVVGRDRDLIGKSVREALPELEGQGFYELLERVRSTGEPFVGRAMRVDLQRGQNEATDTRYLDFVYQPIVEPDGRVGGIFVEGADVTDQVRAIERQRMLIDELNHRVKNMLATVQSIATQTLRSRRPEEFVETFQARLLALSRTHDALTRENWDGADLRELLEQELTPFGEARVTLRGKTPYLPARSVVPLGMVLHELAANAAVHGALSVADGRLRVETDIVETDEGNRKLVLVWHEEGGPRPPPSFNRGFGWRLIERSVKGELKGDLMMDHRPQGVTWQISVPLSEAVQ